MVRGVTHVPSIGILWIDSETPQPVGNLATSTRPINGSLPGRPTVIWPLHGCVELQCWGPLLGTLAGHSWSRTQTFPPKYVHIRVNDLPHKFHPKWTRKTQWNIHRHIRSSQGKLSNIMDVLGRLTFKLNETLHTAYIHYNNPFKDLRTSWSHVNT